MVKNPLRNAGDVGLIPSEGTKVGFHSSPVVKNPLQCRRCSFNPWVGKIPQRRKWQLAPAFLPGKSNGQRSLAGYSQQSCKDSHMTQQLNSLSLSLTHRHTHTHTHTHTREAKILYAAGQLGPHTSAREDCQPHQRQGTTKIKIKKIIIKNK